MAQFVKTAHYVSWIFQKQLLLSSVSHDQSEIKQCIFYSYDNLTEMYIFSLLNLEASVNV